uniref:Uncharacterized protein n=2 Tax=Neospora caninum (strain Liverpool) TaxID=572307 RepID=A0A0F7U9U5_NEOCL|nr:TPA: hypothetical protein BN1204_024800 [Neospora caninum Liverpool]
MLVKMSAPPSLWRLGSRRRVSLGTERKPALPQFEFPAASSSSRQSRFRRRSFSSSLPLCSRSYSSSPRSPLSASPPVSPPQPSSRLSASLFSSALPNFLSRTQSAQVARSSLAPFATSAACSPSSLPSCLSRSPCSSSSSSFSRLPSQASCAGFSVSRFPPPPRGSPASPSLVSSSPTSPSLLSPSLFFCPPFCPSSLPALLTAVRTKMVKSASYRRPSRASPTGQARKPHIGVRRLAAEYVWPGVVLVKQRKVIAFNVETKRRNRHFKLYPGENVKVSKVTNLVALCHGRVKFTHDVSRDVLVVNVLPERREELLREDLWRYRTEHVRSMEENRHICFLRRKAVRMFGKALVNPPTKPPLRPYYFTKYDTWENPALPDVPQLDDDM